MGGGIERQEWDIFLWVGGLGGGTAAEAAVDGYFGRRNGWGGQGGG